MSEMDICTCMIQLAGDSRTIVHRDRHNPLTYPEVNLMMFMHGDRYVTDIKVIDTIETDNSTELENLRVKYGKQAEEAFPGQRPRLPLKAPDDIPRVELPPIEPYTPENHKETTPEDAHNSPARRRKPMKVG
jgi:hypothetical protein